MDEPEYGHQLPEGGVTIDPDLDDLGVLKQVTDEEDTRLGPVLDRVTREENERFLAALSTFAESQGRTKRSLNPRDAGNGNLTPGSRQT